MPTLKKVRSPRGVASAGARGDAGAGGAGGAGASHAAREEDVMPFVDCRAVSPGAPSDANARIRGGNNETSGALSDDNVASVRPPSRGVGNVGLDTELAIAQLLDDDSHGKAEEQHIDEDGPDEVSNDIKLSMRDDTYKERIQEVCRQLWEQKVEGDDPDCRGKAEEIYHDWMEVLKVIGGRLMRGSPAGNTFRKASKKEAIQRIKNDLVQGKKKFSLGKEPGTLPCDDPSNNAAAAAEANPCDDPPKMLSSTRISNGSSKLSESNPRKYIAGHVVNILEKLPGWKVKRQGNLVGPDTAIAKREGSDEDPFDGYDKIIDEAYCSGIYEEYVVGADKGREFLENAGILHDPYSIFSEEIKRKRKRRRLGSAEASAGERMDTVNGETQQEGKAEAGQENAAAKKTDENDDSDSDFGAPAKKRGRMNTSRRAKAKSPKARSTYQDSSEGEDEEEIEYDTTPTGTRRPWRHCKTQSEEKIKGIVAREMQSEKEALGDMLEDDDKELLENSSDEEVAPRSSGKRLAMQRSKKKGKYEDDDSYDEDAPEEEEEDDDEDEDMSAYEEEDDDPRLSVEPAQPAEGGSLFELAGPSSVAHHIDDTADPGHIGDPMQASTSVAVGSAVTSMRDAKVDSASKKEQEPERQESESQEATNTDSQCFSRDSRGLRKERVRQMFKDVKKKLSSGAEKSQDVTQPISRAGKVQVGFYKHLKSWLAPRIRTVSESDLNVIESRMAEFDPVLLELESEGNDEDDIQFYTDDCEDIIQELKKKFPL